MELIATFGLVLLIVFLLLDDVVQFFLKEKETRTYWFKWWLVLAIILGTLIWIILMITGK